MTDNTLRALSRIYASGNIDRESYRAQRLEFLKRISSGEQAVIRFQKPEPEVPTVFPYENDEGDTTQEIMPTANAAAAAANGGSKAKLPMLIGLILLALAVWGVWQWQTGETAIAPTATPAPEVAEATLVETFVANKNWDTTNVVDFSDAWDALTSAERSRLATTPAMGQLANNLIAEIRAEGALIELGDAEDALDKQSQLLNLAEHLGLNNSQLRSEREQWAATRAGKLAAADSNGATTATAIPFEPQVAANIASEDSALESPIDLDEAPADTSSTARREDIAPGTEPATRPPEPEAAAQIPPAGQQALAEAATEQTSVAETAVAAPVATASPSPVAVKQAATGKRSNCKVSLARQRRPYCIDILASGKKGPVLVVLPPGEFEMGGDKDAEQPRHRVTLNYTLGMSLFEVSAAELQRYCQATGRSCPQQPWLDPTFPAVNVDIEMARAYSAWLSDITGEKYRLPSESEWEYATRGGTSTAYPFGDELLPTHARYSFSVVQTQPLAANARSVNSNPFRLFHLLGNVREWVEDSWRGDYNGAPDDGSAYAAAGNPLNVVRGGSYADHADGLRAAARISMAGQDSDIYTGFRVVRMIEN
jgi:formylglycine-generating enzyme required for sulfatase activity